jgi:hypothetical protein
MKQKEGIKEVEKIGTNVSAETGELLSLKQASGILKVHPNTLRNWEKSGLIPVVRVGPRKDRRFHKHVIHSFANGNRPEAPAASEQISVEAEGEPTKLVVNVPRERAIKPVWKYAIGGILALGIIFLILPRTDTDSSVAIRRNPPSILFSDDFEAYDVGSLPKPTWNTYGLWKVVRESGQRFLRGEEGADNPLGLLSHAYTGDSQWRDYRLRFTARVVSGEKTITACIDYLDEKNYYYVRFSESKVSVSLLTDGKKTVLGESPMSPWSISDWHTFTVDLYGNDIDVLLDGDRVLGVANAVLTQGKVAFVVADQVVDFDHVQILETPADARPGT